MQNVNVYDLLASRVSREEKDFHVEMVKRPPEKIYDCAWEIAFVEEISTMLLTRYSEMILEEYVADWLLSKENILGFLSKEMHLSTPVSRSDWYTLAKWIEAIYVEEKKVKDYLLNRNGDKGDE